MVEQYEKMAYLYNMSLEQYYEKLLGITKQEFYEKCLNEGEKQIKKYLIIGAVAKKEDIVITNDEWESEKIDKKIEIQDNNAVIYAKYQLLEKKVLNYLYNTK